MRTEPILEDGVRVGFECVDIITGDRAVIAHKDIDSRQTILGMGIDPTGLDKVAVPASSERSSREMLVMTRSEISLNLRPCRGSCAALEFDMPTVLTLRKSRHPLLQDIRRRDDARILEVTPSIALAIQGA